MDISPPPVAQVASEPALWLNTPEDQPLLQQIEAVPDDKPERDNHPVDLGTPPRGLGPIQLGVDEDATIVPSSRRFWKLHNILDDLPAEHRSVLRDMGRGCMYIVTTPIGLVAVTLYACGVMIEGIALLLKGVGSFGGSFFMRRRNRASQSPFCIRSITTWQWSM